MNDQRGTAVMIALVIGTSMGAVFFAATGQPLTIGLGALVGAVVGTVIEWRRGP